MSYSYASLAGLSTERLPIHSDEAFHAPEFPTCARETQTLFRLLLAVHPYPVALIRSVGAVGERSCELVGIETFLQHAPVRLPAESHASLQNVAFMLPASVIPAKAGIQSMTIALKHL